MNKLTEATRSYLKGWLGFVNLEWREDAVNYRNGHLRHRLGFGSLKRSINKNVQVELLVPKEPLCSSYWIPCTNIGQDVITTL